MEWFHRELPPRSTSHYRVSRPYRFHNSIFLALGDCQDALIFAVARVDAGEFVNLALLDGHYLRRSDAEIFGEKLPAEPQGA